MVKVKILKDYKNYKQDKIYTMNENAAHSLIDISVGILYNTSIPKKYADKMMRSIK